VAEGDGLLIRERTFSGFITPLKPLSLLSFISFTFFTNHQKLAKKGQV
jgi:hypothetical protein